MASEPTPHPPPATAAEAERLRARLAGLEEEQAEQLARAHAALAAAQDRAYWLDRWGLDLNALMRRRGAAELRFALRVLRALLRTGIGLKRSAQTLPGRARSMRAETLEDAGQGGPADLERR